MKTRCRRTGSRQRMTVSSSVVHTQQDSGRKERTTFHSPEVTLAKETLTVHETRSQKLASKSSSIDGHAEAIKDLTLQSSEISNPTPGVSTRSSSRPTKRQKTSGQSLVTTGNQDAKDGHHSATTTVPVTQQKRAGNKKKKVKRQWESWGIRDKNAFFEALHDYGKDFDKIQGYLATKHKRRDDPVNLIKNKDQVRHFYYRTLNKISKFIPEDKQPTRVSDPHQKTLYELLGLTCYGELRKKLGGLGEKQGKKLNELIAYGRTMIRFNGRNIRLKAPLCRAFKDSEPSSLPPIPPKLVLEFLPIDNVAWLAVQRLAKNPRLKTIVSPKKPLNIVLGFLMKKWPVKSQKNGMTMSISVAVPVGFYTSEESSISGADSPMNEDAKKSPGKATEGECATEACSPSETPGKSKKSLTYGEVVTSEIPMEVDKGTTLQRNVIDSNGKAYCNNSSCRADSEKCSDCPSSKSPQHAPTNMNGEIDGVCNPTLWTSETCGNITIGDIYCRLKRPPKLTFQYTWQKEDVSSASHSANALQKLVDVARVEFKNIKKSDSCSKSVASNKESSSLMSSSKSDCDTSTSLTRTTRIAPKVSERLPFIFPSIVPSAVRQDFVTPSISSTNPIFTRAPNRKRSRKNQQHAIHRNNGPVQRTLLPRPGSAAPPGAVAVSFIPQPGQAVGTILASGAAIGPTTSTAQPTVAKSVIRTQSKAATPIPSSPTSVLPSTPSPTPEMPLTPASSPVEFSEVVTTVLETGMQQHPHLVPDTSLTTSATQVTRNVSVAAPLNTTEKLASTSSTLDITFSDGCAEQFVSALHNFGSSNPTSGLDSLIGLTTDSGDASCKIGQLDPMAPMNEDSGSDLLASIMGLKSCPTSFLTSTQTVNAAIPATPSITVMLSSNVHVEELNSGISGGLPTCTSFSGPFGNLLDVNNTDISTSSNLAPQAFFNNTGAEEPASIPPVITNDKLLLCSPTCDGSPLPSPTLSPLRITSPGPDSQWLNGEVSDSLSSFFDKIVVSSEKDHRPGNFETTVGGSDSRDTISQGLLFTPKHLMEVDTALHAIMDESSVDYVNKFQELVKKVSSSGPPKPSTDSLEHVVGGNSSDSSNSSSGILSFLNIFEKGSDK